MQLCRLVYYSTYNISSQRDEAVDLKRILNTSIHSNSKKGVTGGLIFNRQFFAQVLEGDDAAVTQTFVRINGDQRHRDIVLTGMEPVGERLFGAWSMGYAGKSETFQAICAEYGYAGGLEPARMSGPDLTAFILALVTREENFVSSQDIPLEDMGEIYEV
jgi:hypothetical protein